MTVKTQTRVAALVEEINAIKEAKGKAKVPLLQAASEDLKTVLKMAYDSSITFGVNKNALRDAMFTVPENDDECTFEDLMAVLSLCATRSLTGKRAINVLAGTIQSYNDYLLVRLIIEKDLNCGIGVTTILDALPGLFERFQVQLAKSFEDSRFEYKGTPWGVEPKYDGVRAIAKIAIADADATNAVDKYDVMLLSREGNQFTSYPSLEIEIKAWAWANRIEALFFLDGEIVSGDFAKTVSGARKKKSDDKDAVFMAFDFFRVQGVVDEGKVDEIRRYVLERCVWSKKVTLIERRKVTTVQEVRQAYEDYRERGLEGAMCKNPNSPYEFKRRYHWLKLKDEQTVDAPIVGWEPGEIGTKYENVIGKFIIELESGIRVAVGGGLSDELRAEDPEQFIGRIIEVEYHEMTPDGSLRHPRMNRFRDVLTGEFE
jgi:DNA ligase 1